MLKNLATAFGVIFIAVGVLGFVPGVTTNDHLLGIFHINLVHNVIHLLSGAVALFAGMTSAKSAKIYFQVFGIVYALVAVLGFVYGNNDVLGLVANNMPDTLLHIAIAAVALCAGFALEASPANARA